MKSFKYQNKFLVTLKKEDQSIMICCEKLHNSKINGVKFWKNKLTLKEFIKKIKLEINELEKHPR